MPTMKIETRGDGCWPDLAEKEVIMVEDFSAATLPHGMSNGSASVSFRIDLPDGRVVLAQTSAALLLILAEVVRATEKADDDRGDPADAGSDDAVHVQERN